ncbi:MAG: cytochrome b/b6 domain-containing protein, partial [Desulfobacterota bacterium]|nr:cytochrome b/b6 domain-containing protein [Thermodesulfobacteriota bacterium]
MRERIIEEKAIVLRHSPVELIEHWVLAVSGFLLIFSGFGELPMYKRFMVTEIPGLGWAGDFFIHLKIHYLSAIVFVSVMVFHAIYHGWLGHRGLIPRRGDFRASLQTILSMLGRGREPEFDKYLPEQRLAYAYLAGISLILVVTGIIKVVKNLPEVYLPPEVVTAATLTHTFATIFFLFGIIAHLAAQIFKVNRPLTKSIFTGTVDLQYAKSRHPVWYEALMAHVRQSGREVATEGEETTGQGMGHRESSDSQGAKQEPGPEPTEVREEETLTTLKVKGMSCEHCVRSVTQALERLDGLR